MARKYVISVTCRRPPANCFDTKRIRRDVLAALEADHPGALFIKYRAKQLEHARKLKAGKAVMLSPGADLLPWYVVDGNWSRGQDGKLTVKLNRTELIKDYELRLPPRAGPIQIGVGSSSHDEGLSARFREIRIILPKD